MDTVKGKELEVGKKNSIQKKYSSDEARSMVLEFATIEGDLKNNLQKFGDSIFPKLIHGNEEEKKEATKRFNKDAVEVMIALETDTHVGLMETFYSQYRGLAKEFSDQLIRDYRCDTSAEKALAEVITNAYVRVIDNSRRLNANLGDPGGGQVINENRTKYLAMLSKQVDRANRQFITALTTLKMMKSPSIEMNIKAKTAFVSQNQQVNLSKNEIIEPK